MADMTMAEFVEAARTGRFFTVSFVKRGDGSERVMTCRTGVKKGTKGGSIGYDPDAKHLLPVYDVRVPGFRMVNLEQPLTARIKGRRYVWDPHKQVFTEKGR
jgi:hypothetical protein